MLGLVGGEGVEEFVSTVFTCENEEVYIHGGWDGLGRGLFTWRYLQQLRYLQYDQVFYVCQR